MLNKNLWDYMFGALAKNLYYLLLFALGICGLVMFIRKKETRMISVSFIIYAVVIVLNGYLIANAEQRSEGFVEYLVYPLPMFALAYCMNYKHTYTGIIKIMPYWGVITSLLAGLEYFTKTPILPTSYEGIYRFFDGSTSFRSVVFIGSPMILSVLLGISLITAIYLSEFEKNKNYKKYIPIIFLGILFTGSRGPLVSTLMGIILMYYLRAKHERKNKKIIGFFVWSFFLLFLILLKMSLFPDFETGISFVDNTISRFGSSFNLSEWGNKERILRWTYYINQFIKYPLFGYGIASTSASVISNAKVTLHGITTESGVLARLVETGVVGVIPYYCMFICSIKISISQLKRDVGKLNQSIFYIISGILCLYIVENLILQISLDIYCTFFAWLFIAYGINVKHFILHQESCSSDLLR